MVIATQVVLPGPRNLVTGDCCGDAVGFATLRKAAMQGRRQAERAGVTPRIARSTSKAMRPPQRDHPMGNSAASASAFVLALGTTRFLCCTAMRIDEIAGQP